MAMKMPKRDRKTPVESIRHKDKRKNIPTEELRDFVAQDENAPKTMLYPRDPSLDPQLVWKGVCLAGLAAWRETQFVAKPKTKSPGKPGEAETGHVSRTARGNVEDVLFGYGYGYVLCALLYGYVYGAAPTAVKPQRRVLVRFFAILFRLIRK